MKCTLFLWGLFWNGSLDPCWVFQGEFSLLAHKDRNKGGRIIKTMSWIYSASVPSSTFLFGGWGWGWSVIRQNSTCAVIKIEELLTSKLTINSFTLPSRETNFSKWKYLFLQDFCKPIMKLQSEIQKRVHQARAPSKEPKCNRATPNVP